MGLFMLFFSFSTFVRYAETGFLYGVQLNHKTIILFETNCSSEGLSLKAISPLFTQFEQGTNMTSVPSNFVILINLFKEETSF